MLGTAIIVFREVLEASLIVSIVMAACKGAAGRNFWVACGIMAGVLGAGLVAAFAASIAAAVSGIGQELLNATILFVAVAMLGCHNIWMSRHGRELASRVQTVGQAVVSGMRPLYVLAVVVGVAVLREGAETVLFVYGMAAGGGDAAGVLLAGSIIGLAAGIAIGATLYFGLLRIPMKRLFSVTNAMILLLAAGMAAQGAGFLVQADVLPSLGDALWDTSAVLSEQSILGKVLHTLIGYIAQPTGIELVFYVATLLVIGTLMQLLGIKSGGSPPGSAVVAVAIAIGLAGSISAPPAYADHKVYSPIIEEGVLEFEARGHRTVDSSADKNDQQTHKYAIAYGVNSWWYTELFGKLNKEPQANFRYDATAWENIFQLTPQGKYWVDVGSYTEYSRSAIRGQPDELEFKLLLEKDVEPLVLTANLIFNRNIGKNAGKGVGFEYAVSAKYPWKREIQFGVEAFGQPGRLTGFDIISAQQHIIGPVVLGKFNIDPIPGIFNYNVGYLVGLTPGSPKGTAKWGLEYEIPF